MIYIKLLLFVVPIINCYLNKNSWTIIKSMKVKYSQPFIQDKLNKIIYNNYQKLSFSKSISFKNKHYRKCKAIPLMEVNQWANTGLLEAINNYDYSRNTNFGNFAGKYIHGALHTGLTNQYSINKIPKYKRRRKNKIEKELPILHPNYYLYKSKHVIDYESKHQNEELWYKINQCDKKIRRIFYLKFDPEFNKIRSNKHVAELMCYSEEHVRKQIHDTIQMLTERKKFPNK